MKEHNIIIVKKRIGDMGYEFYCEDCLKDDICFCTMPNGKVTYWCKSFKILKVNEEGLMSNTCNYKEIQNNEN